MGLLAHGGKNRVISSFTVPPESDHGLFISRIQCRLVLIKSFRILQVFNPEKVKKEQQRNL